MIKVLRQTLSGSSTAFEFPVKGTKFLVKNLSDQDCFVNFEDITNEDECILIPKQTAQVVLMNESSRFGFDTLYVKGTGLVEVQVVSY